MLTVVESSTVLYVTLDFDKKRKVVISLPCIFTDLDGAFSMMKFKTKIYHPNIKDGTGEICDAAIKNTWVPTLNANYIIKMLKELIENPNGESP